MLGLNDSAQRLMNTFLMIIRTEFLKYILKLFHRRENLRLSRQDRTTLASALRPEGTSDQVPDAIIGVFTALPPPIFGLNLTDG